ncbi:MAG TPA: iron dependent repressor, metal binding and dimerization domain protein [Chloroflexota bacterium]|nr:iron dependent repressor, metal binding and dimerization domain protein [Chloroflexota bacterium]
MREHDRGQRVAEDYVAAIATLEAEGRSVIGARLADLFGVSAPTVTETLGRLQSAGYVRVGPTKSVVLCSLGRELAQRTLRRRRVAERFFVDALGLPIAEAQAEADRWEHALSDQTADRLGAALGHPDQCPHGDPVDEINRTISSVVTTLDRAPTGIDLVVEHVSSEADVASTSTFDLDSSGLVPGSRLTVVENRDDELLVRCASGNVNVPHVAAQMIRVRAARARRDSGPLVRAEPHYRVAVASVQGACAAGHRSGDHFEFSHCAPGGLCLEALQKLYPAMSALRLAGHTAGPIHVPCPEDGIVTFTVEAAPTSPAEDGVRS